MSKRTDTHRKMKKLLLAVLTTGIAVSSNITKRTTTTINSGNYDDAIEISLKKLRKNHNMKGKQGYVLLLKEAYAKAQTRNMERYRFLQKRINGLA